ncbi:uncharacterized protein ACWYII_010020 isoform 1-T2 [Salvelinus alpinus]|uniref:uncharacterized protein n=1 Tax=Salvelinus alpinus TaxID=8036 RepID=UPI0039FBC3D6
MSQSRGLCMDRGHSAWFPRPRSWLQRPISCFQRRSLRASADPTSSDNVYTSCLYAQGFRCTLQQRPSCSSARLTPKSNARGAEGRPVSSALGRVENSPGRGTRAMSRPVTAPGGGGRRRDPGQRPGAQIRDRTECPRLPCNTKQDNTHRQQQDTWRGRRPFSTSSTLHLYLPSSSYYEDDEQEMDIELEKEDVRPTIENNGLQDTTEMIRSPTPSENVTMLNPTNNTSLQQDHKETVQIQEAPPLNPSLQGPSEDIIRPQVPTEDINSMEPTDNPRFQGITHYRTTGLVVPKQRAHGYDMEQQQECIPLQIMPAAVQGRAPTSVRQHVNRLPKIKTTKTFVWGLSGPQEIKSVFVLQRHIGRYTNQT